mmetsp:Transcript_4782/g.10880  ORF Transcript_4782/g.10880 Transcript_4782/m.10880 type:complete len:212 (+) Transcript_4782:492-1127(+)
MLPIAALVNDCGAGHEAHEAAVGRECGKEGLVLHHHLPRVPRQLEQQGPPRHKRIVCHLRRLHTWCSGQWHPLQRNTLAVSGEIVRVAVRRVVAHRDEVEMAMTAQYINEFSGVGCVVKAHVVVEDHYELGRRMLGNGVAPCRQPSTLGELHVGHVAVSLEPLQLAFVHYDDGHVLGSVSRADTLDEHAQHTPTIGKNGHVLDADGEVEQA